MPDEDSQIPPLACTTPHQATLLLFIPGPTSFRQAHAQGIFTRILLALFPPTVFAHTVSLVLQTISSYIRSEFPAGHLSLLPPHCHSLGPHTLGSHIY